jgi:hypothetical protein
LIGADTGEPQECVMAIRDLKKTKKKKRQRIQTVRGSSDDYTIPEWCLKRRIGKTTFYKLQALGLAPSSYKLGKARRITHAADLAWQQQREQQAA